MEVHHKHHHISRERKEKHWLNYLFEFFMLFLAVFCGFVAEWRLEHVIEHQREKQFIQSMIEDLKSDTISLNYSIKNIAEQVKGKDAFILLLDKGEWTNQEVNKLYDMHWQYVGFRYRMIFSKRTSAQLFNAGGLRMIRNKKASDSITIYITDAQLIENGFQPDYINYAGKVLDFSATIFDNKYLRYLPDESLKRAPTTQPVLLSKDKKNIKNFAFLLEQEKDISLYFVIELKKQKMLAIQLMRLLKSEYHLQNE